MWMCFDVLFTCYCVDMKNKNDFYSSQFINKTKNGENLMNMFNVYICQIRPIPSKNKNEKQNFNFTSIRLLNRVVYFEYYCNFFSSPEHSSYVIC